MRFDRAFALGLIAALGAAIGLNAACSSDATTPGTAPTGDAGTVLSATCTTPGTVTAGPTDSHCGGKFQVVNAASCTVTDAGTGDDDKSDAGDAGAAGDDDDDCEYGPTMFGTSGNDDDCKYTVSYTNGALCEGAGGVTFTLTVKNATDNSPVTGIPDGIDIEAFIPTDPTATCDTKSTHPSPSSASLKETSTPGVYTGQVVFDAPGTWTVRFHIHEECADELDDSPHGHAAFRFTIP